MSNELIIDVSKAEISIAQLEDKKLVELHNERREEGFSVGDIYIGRVRKLMPGLNAAFVDVGYEKDAFLHYLDLGPQFSSLSKFLIQATARKPKSNPFYSMKMEHDIDKNGKISSQPPRRSSGRRNLASTRSSPQAPSTWSSNSR